MQGYTHRDEINPELIPAVEQWMIDKSADEVDRLIDALQRAKDERKKNEMANHIQR